MSSCIYSKNMIYSSTELPLTMMLLEEWSLIQIEGLDSKKYLQSQFTIDMNLLLKSDHKLCAHCDFNGKVLSTMRLFHYENGYAYIQRKSVSQIQLKKLKKYSIFSKLIIKELNNFCLVGFAGLHSKIFLLDFFKTLPNEEYSVKHEKNVTILWFKEPNERFLLILSLEEFLNFKKRINKKILLNNSKQWLLLDIEAGFPVIDKKCSKKFTPQAINLDKLNGISFKKGCYYGQETIAKIFFNNLNKRFLCSLISRENISPKIGSFIEIKVKNIWYKIGVLLSLVHIEHRETLIQVVLYKTAGVNNLFRVNGFKNIFSIKK